MAEREGTLLGIAVRAFTSVLTAADQGAEYKAIAPISALSPVCMNYINKT